MLKNVLPLKFVQRHFNMKKLTIETIKNPHVQQIHDKQLKKREKRSTLDRLVEKR